jgi:hypothetical protein
MKYILTSLILLFSLVSMAQVNHTDAKGRKQGAWVKTYESGKKRYEGAFKDDVPVGHFHLLLRG